ncbi:hypothetical protein KJ641_00375 [Patescibacteria group bacterium]|nr:hypothetical protein [Patescibacteria group bacterium]MBU1895314.1 hypothetical protein [Patescibacteria group bacterium]
MDKKRIAIIIGFLIIVVVLGYVMYRLFFAPAPTITPTVTPTTTAGGAFPTADTGGATIIPGTTPGILPTTGESVVTPVVPEAETRLTQIVDNRVNGARVAGDGQLNFYNEQDGKFYRRSKTGRLELMSDQVFFNVDTITWSSATDEAILEYPDGANIYYNFNTKRQVTLPKHWEDFSFSGGGENIAAKSMGLSPENHWLISATPDGNEINLIEPMGNNADKVSVKWSPSGEVVATSLTGKALGADRQELLFVGQYGENFPSTVIEGRGFDSQWSPTGDKLLYNVYSSRSDFKPELWVVNASGDEIGTGRKLLQINTWSEKCAFGGNRFVYCGVPQTMETGAGFAPALSDNIPDFVYRIDTQTGLRTQIPLTENHTIESMTVSDDGNTLYFTDKKQAGLFELDI